MADVSTTEDTPTKQDKASTLLSRAMKVLALPVSLAAGLFYGSSIVRDKSYDKLRNLGAFEVTKGDRLKKAHDMFPAWGVTKDITHDLDKLNFEHAKKIDQRIVDLGYDTTMKRYKGLHPNQQTEAVLGAFTAGGVALGVMLTIADHKHLFGNLLGNDKDDQTPSK